MCGEREDSLTAAMRSGPASRRAMSETSELTATMRVGCSAEAAVASPSLVGVQAVRARTARAAIALIVREGVGMGDLSWKWDG